jgi:diguanylate cyclase (GGDEF)-like protein
MALLGHLRPGAVSGVKQPCVLADVWERARVLVRRRSRRHSNTVRREVDAVPQQRAHPVPVRGAGRVSVARLAELLPHGRRLRPAVWQQRHAGMLWLLWLHVPGIFLFALARGYDLLHATTEAALLVVPALVALTRRLPQSIRSAAAALGLVVASSLVVHLWAGQIEAHFHFFVVLAFLSLYQAWLPFLVALAYVVVHHGLGGWLASGAVYDHAGGVANPWRWALIHASFVLAASVANLLAWRLTEHEALHDELTGLGNRALLLEAVAAQTDGAGCALLVADLDDFKSANDAFGHDVGDAALTVVAGRLAALVGTDGVVARLGGDQFAVLLTKRVERADDVARQVQQAMCEPVAVGELRLLLNASIGVAVAPPGTTASDLLRNADLALHAAKRTGRGTVTHFAEQMHADVRRRAELEAALREALADGQFVVHYQPLFRAGSRAVVGAEALVRWQHPELGLVPPVEFIPLAEDCGLIVELGRFVLREACRQAAAWPVGGEQITMSVNLSARQLVEPGLIDAVTVAVAESGLSPQRLCLEITESALIKDFDSVLPVLTALRTAGVHLALDDFGTGYSSLSYLQRLPVDMLKIDRSFVRDATELGPQAAIVLATTQLAHALGMSVTAEGVETAEQLAALQAMGADVLQGFGLAKPMPAAQLEAFLARGEGAGPLIATALPRPRAGRHDAPLGA